MDYVGCSYEVLDEGGFLISDIATRAGTILSVYLGPSAVYALLPQEADVKALYPYLRELLGAPRVYLYVDRLGHYDPYSDTFSDLCDEETLLGEVYEKLYQGQQVYTDSALGRWFTGIVYLLTCGLFLAGWLVDLLQLFMAIQKDKHGALLCPLENKAKKLTSLPIGIGISVLALFLYFHSFQLFSLEPSQGLVDLLSRALSGLPNNMESP